MSKKKKVEKKLNGFEEQIHSSNYISRDLSWLEFNQRVLDQAKDPSRKLMERLKFLAISASNLDEFFTIRVGSLYNYIDYKKSRIDYCGLNEYDFRTLLLTRCAEFVKQQERTYIYKFWQEFEDNGLKIIQYHELSENELIEIDEYYKNTIFPMLTPMAFDNHRTFPLLKSRTLIFGVVTKDIKDKKSNEKISFIQVPKNLKSFYSIERDGYIAFLPIEEIIKHKISTLFRNVAVEDYALFRITRNGDFTLEESDDLEINFIKELERKLKDRRTGRVVRLELLNKGSKKVVNLLKERWDIDDFNIIDIKTMLDYTRFWELIKHNKFQHLVNVIPHAVKPLGYGEHDLDTNIFDLLSERDVLLHHPYNDFEPVAQLLEKAADDPNVLAIKQTIYRLADDSRITNALLKAAENGKHVSVLFEVKARFDELKNINEARKLEKAGAYIIYGVNRLKTHTKLLQVIRKEGDKIKRYVHLGSGNYNEDTARLYTDVSLLSSNDEYGKDVSEFFNAITGHSVPGEFENLITAPLHMRSKLIELINREVQNKLEGKKALIVIKINSLEDNEVLDALYLASRAGVKIKLIVRGICCIRPKRRGLSENIQVRSIVGDYLEHSRIFYFHNNGSVEVFAGSADIMTRSFERRIESIFKILDPFVRKEMINILDYNLKDNTNSYSLNEDGTYSKVICSKNDVKVNLHDDLYHIKSEDILKIKALSF